MKLVNPFLTTLFQDSFSADQLVAKMRDKHASEPIATHHVRRDDWL